MFGIRCLVIAVPLLLAGCSFEDSCAQQGLRAGTPEFQDCVAGKNSEAAQYRAMRARNKKPHGR